MVLTVKRNKIWFVVPVFIIIGMITPVSADIPFFDETDEYDFYGSVIIASDDLHLPLEGEASNCPLTEGTIHCYRTDIPTSTAFPWNGYSSAGWDHGQIVTDTCSAHFRITTDIWTDDPDYWYFHLDPPKGYIPVSAHSLNAYGTALDSQTVFYDYNNLPVGDYSFLFQVKRDPKASQASFSQEFSGSPPQVTISFDASKSTSSVGPIVNYTWSFGDRAATGFGQIVKHNYVNIDANSDYDVTLTVTDVAGFRSSMTQKAIFFPSSAHVRAPPAPESIAVPENLQKTKASVSSDTVPDIVVSSRDNKIHQPTGQSGSFTDFIVVIPQTILSIVNVSPASTEEVQIMQQDTAIAVGERPLPDHEEDSIRIADLSEGTSKEQPSDAGSGSSGKYSSGQMLITRDFYSEQEYSDVTNTTPFETPAGTVMQVEIPTTGISNLQPAATRVICPIGYSPCLGFCKNLTDDNSHCGACGNVCMNGTVCSNGQCVAQRMVTTQPTRLGEAGLRRL